MGAGDFEGRGSQPLMGTGFQICKMKKVQQIDGIDEHPSYNHRARVSGSLGRVLEEMLEEYRLGWAYCIVLGVPYLPPNMYYLVDSVYTTCILP